MVFDARERGFAFFRGRSRILGYFSDYLVELGGKWLSVSASLVYQ